MRFKLIKKDEEFWLLSDHMARKVGEYFAERHTTGDWGLYSVDTLNDLVHKGYKILASTKSVPGIPGMNKDVLEAITRGNKNYDISHIKEAMGFLAENMERSVASPTVIIENYTRSLLSEWLVEVDTEIESTVFSGGLIPDGVIGGRGIRAHHSYSPVIEEDGNVRIKWIVQQ